MVVFTSIIIREYGFPSSCRAFDGRRFPQGLICGLLVRLGLVGQVSGDEELGHFLLLGGEGPELGDALDLFHGIFINAPSQLRRGGRRIRG
jgi:hypothetical protein